MLDIFRNLIGLSFLGVILDMILPSGEFRKYLKSVFGLIMLITLLGGALKTKSTVDFKSFDKLISSEEDSVRRVSEELSEEILLDYEKKIKERLLSANIEITYSRIDFDSEFNIKQIKLKINGDSNLKDKTIQILTEEFNIDENSIVIGD